MIGWHELQYCSLRERIEFVVNTAQMAGFELLAYVFLVQLKTVPHYGIHGCNIVYKIVSSLPYKPIYKLFNDNLQF